MLYRLKLCGVMGVALFVLSGCGPKGKEIPAGMVPFTGTVALDDKPLVGATISFFSGMRLNAATISLILFHSSRRAWER